MECLLRIAGDLEVSTAGDIFFLNSLSSIDPGNNINHISEIVKDSFFISQPANDIEFLLSDKTRLCS